ncbi:hypothetical protein Dsin_005242 [Dipteronia sinensis]|uniref:RNase H type-1 domain-containing protein n=1 Tax=Dipteronia sinensis TaxID=43782 RepID=A0AAE0AX04_9ROSI|nr:hypothetical protein Dsin_005242 [Dipteronia sinensis]
MNRGLPNDCVCPGSERSFETTIHAVWGCVRLKPLRKECGFMEGFHWKQFMHFREFFISCINCLHADQLALLCIILWRVWFLRNQIVHSNKKGDVHGVVNWSRAFLMKYQGAIASCVLREAPVQQMSVRWNPPTGDMYKVNVDASSFTVLNSLETRVWCQAEIESDTLGVVNLINGKETPLADIGILLCDISDLLCSVPIVVVSFVSRKANMVAHTLAKMGLTSSDDQFWLENYPPDVESCVLADMPG